MNYATSFIYGVFLLCLVGILPILAATVGIVFMWQSSPVLAVVLAVALLILIGITVADGLKSEKEHQLLEERRLKALQISDVDNMDGIDFEHYLCRLLRHSEMSADVTSASNDFGVDIIASEQGKRTAVQAKRYAGNVSRTAVSDAVAGKAHYGCDDAMVITNSYFTKGAIELAESTGCILVDRDTLTTWIVEFQDSDLDALRVRRETAESELKSAIQATDVGLKSMVGQMEGYISQWKDAGIDTSDFDREVAEVTSSYEECSIIIVSQFERLREVHERFNEQDDEIKRRGYFEDDGFDADAVAQNATETAQRAMETLSERVLSAVDRFETQANRAPACASDA